MPDEKTNNSFEKIEEEEIDLKEILGRGASGGVQRERGARKSRSEIRESEQLNSQWRQRKSSFECTYKETLDLIANSRCDHDDNASGAGELARDNYLTCEVDQISDHFEMALSMIALEMLSIYDDGNDVWGWLNDIEREISSSKERIHLLETCRKYHLYLYLCLENQHNQRGNAPPAQVKLENKFNNMGKLITLIKERDFVEFEATLNKVADDIKEHREGCDFVNMIRRLLSLLSQYFPIFKSFKSKGEQCMDEVHGIFTNNKLAFFNHPTEDLKRSSTDDSVDLVEPNDSLVMTSRA